MDWQGSGKAEQVTITETNAIGLKTERKMWDVTITGEPPCYGGWTFLAALDFDQDSGLIVRTAPGIESVDRSLVRDGECDHCHIKRYRKTCYLVKHEDGRQLQVGSTCLKDFLGHNINAVWISPPSESDLEAEFSSGGYAGESTWATDTVLAAAWASIQVSGFRPSSSYDTPTKYLVEIILDPRSKLDREYAAECEPYFKDSYGMAKVIRDYVLSDDFAGSSEYVINLKNIMRGEFIAPRFFGFAVSAPSAWAKAQDRELTRKREAAEITNEWHGAKGDKLEITIKVQNMRAIEGDYGTTMLYTMIGEDGRVYKWFSSNHALGGNDETIGQSFR